jgi:hypothetical protein
VPGSKRAHGKAPARGNMEHKGGELGAGHQGWHQPWAQHGPGRPQ